MHGEQGLAGSNNRSIGLGKEPLGGRVLRSAIWMNSNLYNTLCILDLLYSTFANFGTRLSGVGGRNEKIAHEVTEAVR